MREYEYVGSPDFIPKGDFPPRLKVEEAEALLLWMQDHRSDMDIEECIPATYVVDVDGQFWIADRGSEHVACARVGRVLAAGEAFLSGMDETPYIHRITNQSTGYCPEPESWQAVERALAGTGLEFPSGFDPAFEFRICPSCQTLAIVKDGYYTCLMCGADLPLEWNIEG
ncbi:hypothetical protein SAMN02745181_0848 [Rubritalea squalenifaciens DSM 18772]|uniref:Uncharacterized protein n=1 Tax=Rubritalea squalenifaciens DSM 18772 TaxID=1123071 RepID=A0A1M6DVR8_9BACT|nr:hypothetical protein [Rubritalea squalenifaciens]SHI77336.1 hypothetical protein SAMN02745181_0848 [Rubritalea squalenifaciens DSM 18772]